MAGYSARQSTYTTGDVIAAADTNDEFNQLISAFNASTGHTHDGTAGDGGPVTTLRDSNSYNKVLIDDTNNHLEFYVNVSSSAVQQFRVQDGAIVPITDNDIDLGTSSLEFKDLHLDGTANIDSLVADAISLGGTSITATGTEINLIDGDATVGTTAVADGDGIIHNDSGTMRVTSAATFKTYFTTGVTAAAIAADDITTGDAAVSLETSAGNITIDAQGTDTDIILKGTDGGVDTTFLTIDGSNAGKATFNSDVVVGGDLTVTGDDITMGTNTSGNLLIADGTNFNSVAVGSLSEISTVANDDVLLAVDTSGGGLKKITRSTLTAGLVTGSEISNVVEDTTPQLGGDLDMNGNDIVTTSNADIDLAPNGTGKVVVKGNTNPGTIVFNCESNSHGQTVKSQPHSASVTNVLTLPAGGDQELVGTTATQTLTNKTLAITSLDIDGGTDIGANLADADLLIVDDGAGGTNRKMAASRLQTYIEGKIGGDITISSGTAAIGSGVIVNADINASAAIADSKLDTISTAGKVDLAALEIDGGTDIGADLTTSDLIVVDDGAGGTNRKAALSRVVTLMTAQGFSTDDPTALAIALG
jgi:hypothetical protein